jgi:hypothetical protein
MKTRIGLWIDHRQAIVVRIFDEGEVTSHILSHLPKRVRFSGASHDKAELNPHDAFAEGKRDRRFEELLTRYYDAIIEEIMPVDNLFIMGPGAAKLELHKRIEACGLNLVIFAVETTDKMTENQIRAKTRDYFAETQHPNSLK